MKDLQGFLQLAVHWDGASSSPFGNALSQQDLIPNGAVAAQDHFPFQPRYFASAQASPEA